MAVDGRRVLFRPGRIHASGRSVGGIRTGGGQGGQGAGKGGGVGGGRGTGKGHGVGLANLQQLVTLLAATSSTAGAVVPSPVVAASALVLLSTTTLGANGTIDVTGIDQTYNDLVLELICRGAAAATVDTLGVQFNNDTGANYYSTYYYATNAANNPGGSFADTKGWAAGIFTANTATAGLATYLAMEILGYTNTSWTKNAIAQWGAADSLAAGHSYTGHSTVTWNNTAAINRVKFFGVSTANLIANSTLRIYGRK